MDLAPLQHVPEERYDTSYPGAPEVRETFQYFEQYFYFGPERESRIAAANALCPGGSSALATGPRST
jgi:hypothetical protein